METLEQNKSEERFRKVLELAPDGIVVIDQEKKMQIVNVQTEKMFGYTREEMIGKEVEMLMPNRFRQVHPAHERKFITVQKPGPMGVGKDLFGQRKDGSVFPIEVSLVPLHVGDEKEGISVLASIRDVTERKEIEEKLRKTNKELSQKTEELIKQSAKLEDLNKELKTFSYTVSHDLKNPLSVIKYTSDKIYKNYNTLFSENDRKLYDAMLNQTAFMNTLITDLLQYALVGYNTEETTEVDLNKTVNEIIKKYEMLASVDFKITNPLPVVIFAETQISQVFDNLIGNAVKYMDKPNARIELGSEDRGDLWKFFVKDNGGGIEEKYLDKIFQPFKKAHTRKDIQSTGIGLSIIKKIIENAGGTVGLETEIGKGSTFYFTIRKKLM